MTVSKEERKTSLLSHASEVSSTTSHYIGNQELGIGFLSDPRRLNVSITRAKYGLIIVGNSRVLATNPVWSNMLHHYQDQNLLVEGAITNLKPIKISLKDKKSIKQGYYTTDNKEDKEG